MCQLLRKRPTRPSLWQAYSERGNRDSGLAARRYSADRAKLATSALPPVGTAIATCMTYTTSVILAYASLATLGIPCKAPLRLVRMRSRTNVPIKNQAPDGHSRIGNCLETRNPREAAHKSREWQKDRKRKYLH